MKYRIRDIRSTRFYKSQPPLDRAILDVTPYRPQRLTRTIWGWMNLSEFAYRTRRAAQAVIDADKLTPTDCPYFTAPHWK